MATTATKKTRRGRSDDGKGDRHLIAGKRFRTPGVPPGPEANKLFARIRDVTNDNEVFCRTQLGVEPHWNHIALWAANSIRFGELRVPLPPIDDVVATYDEANLPPATQDQPSLLGLHQRRRLTRPKSDVIG